MQAVPGGANYWDLGQLESTVSIQCVVRDQDTGDTWEKRYAFPIPEETMSELEDLIGDGNATVTVGKEFKASEDFKTAGSTAWVKLTCGQNLDTILKAREIATTLALGFAEQGFEQAQYVMDKMCGREAKAPPPLEVVVNPEDKVKEKPKGEPGRTDRSSGGDMFTRKGDKTTFDSISLVECHVSQNPVDPGISLRAKLCYVDSKTGHTYGHIDLKHETQLGLESLSDAAIKAWQAFCRQVETDQGFLIFGEGQPVDPNQRELFGDDTQAESRQTLNKGLGGGS